MRKTFRFLLIAFITFLLLVSICHITFRPPHRNNAFRLDDGWDIEFNHEHFENVHMSELTSLIGRKIQRGDVFVLRRTLNISPDMQFPIFIFLSRYSAWEFYENGVLTDSANIEKYQNKNFIGCNYNFITINSREPEVDIELKLYTGENSAYNYFEAPQFGEYKDVLAVFTFMNLFALSTGIFLIIFGASFVVITLIFYKTLPDIVSQLFSSLLFIDSGIWILCYFRLLDLFVYTNGHTGEIEFISLFLMIPLMYLILGCIQDLYKDWTFLVLGSTSSIICIFLAVMHFRGLIHMNRSLPYYQAIATVCYIFIGVVVAKSILQKKLLPSEKNDLLGLSIFAASVFINFFFFGLEKAGILAQSMVTRKIVPMGALIFVFANLINYFIYISESFARRKEYDSLTHLAYADGLTDLPNRSRYDKYMSDLDEGSEDYCIISMDLNGLKEINDTEGHAAGDKYLLEFATTMQQCFENKAFIARIGGDEFVAIMKEEYWPEIESILNRLRDTLEVKNVLYPGYRRSVATGYAFSTESKDGGSHSVYLLADRRMYENKKIMHEKLGITARI